MAYSDLDNNDNLPTEARLKHLEREAGYVRANVEVTDKWLMGIMVMLVIVVMCLAIVILKK